MGAAAVSLELLCAGSLHAEEVDPPERAILRYLLQAVEKADLKALSTSTIPHGPNAMSVAISTWVR